MAWAATRKYCYVIISMMTAIIFMGTQRETLAASDGFCTSYADTAVDQYQRNLDTFCNFQGAPWNDDPWAHYNWCRGVDESNANRETTQRTTALAQCLVDHDRCEAYAETAVIQNGENKSLGCNLQGPRWTDDTWGHYQWCRRVAQSNADTETQERNNALAGCMVARNRCDTYAKTAVDQNQENIRLQCGFGGPRWTNDEPGHRGWCFRVPASNADAETKARTDALRRCLVVANRCEKYAKTAVYQYLENVRLQCGFSGQPWSDNETGHRNWCKGAPEATANSETLARANALNGCRNRASVCAWKEFGVTCECVFVDDPNVTKVMPNHFCSGLSE